VFCFNVVGAHGRYFSQGKCPGRMSHHSPRALSKREQNGFRSAPGTRRLLLSVKCSPGTRRRTRRL
jgi:hypothetical protein